MCIVNEHMYVYTWICIQSLSSPLGHKGSYLHRQILCCKEPKLRYSRSTQCCVFSLFQHSRNCQKLEVELSGTPALINQREDWFLPLPVPLLVYHKDLQSS